MRIGQAAQAFSDLLTLPLSRVQSTSRFLRESDLVRTGARGSNAHHLSDLEISRFLIALMASESPTDAVQRCKYFAMLPVDISTSVLANGRSNAFEGETLETVLRAVLKAIRIGRIQPDAEHPFLFGGAMLEVDITGGTAIIQEQPNGSFLNFSENTLKTRNPDDFIIPPFFSRLSRVTKVMHETLAEIASFGSEGEHI